MCWAFGQRYQAHFNKLEVFLFGLFREIVPIWLATIFFLLTYGSIGNWSFPLAIIPLFGLIYWSKLFKTVTTVWFGYAHLLLLLFGLVISMGYVHSFHFMDQLLFAQLSVVGLIASLWGLKSFFRIIGIEADFSFGLANSLRIVFFCLMPLLFVHLVRKIEVDFIGSAIWVSVLLTYFLYKKLKYLALSIELIALTLIAFLFVIITLDSIGVLIGLTTLTVLVFFEKGYEKVALKKSAFKPILNFVPYLSIVMLWLVVFKLSQENASIAFVFIAVVLIVAIYFKDKIAIIDSSFILATKLSVLALFLSFVFYPFNESGIVPLFSIGYLVMLGVLLHNKKSWYDLEKKINRWNFTFVLHQLAIIITVSIMLNLFLFNVLGPLSSVILVVYAIVLVFITLKQGRPFINKVSISLFAIALLKIISIDISEFSMVQKVIVFLILGLLLLAASYGYVKLKKRFEVIEEPKIGED